MYPTLTLGTFQVSTYLVTYALAILVLGGVVWWRNRQADRREGQPPRSAHEIIDALFYVLLGTIAGGWATSALPRLAAYLAGGPLPPYWWALPLYWLGQVGGGSLAGMLYLRRQDRPVGRSFDLVAPAVPLAQAVGRVGCLMAGCCYGKVTDAWPALFLPDVHGLWARRYPTRIADILANLLIAGIILAFEAYAARKHSRTAGWPFRGFLFLLYVDLYSVQRFVFEFWRADTPLLAGPFTWNHLYCAVAAALATGLMVRNLRPAR